MRAFQIRMPKKPKIVDVQMRRGFRNNGLIEIEMEDSDSDQAFEPEQGEGIVNRLPERGIILDFMDKMKRHQPVRGPASDEFDGRPLSEQQTILNLVKLARREDEVNSGTANLTNLVMTLVVSFCCPATIPEPYCSSSFRIRSKIIADTESGRSSARSR